MGERLQAALDYKGWEPPQLIAATGLSKGTIYNILNDVTKPEKIRDVTAAKICAALGIRSGWLVREEGHMDPVLHEDFMALEEGRPLGIGGPPPRQWAAPQESSRETPPGYVRFDLLDGAGGMGLGVVNQDYPEVVRQVEVAEWEVRRKLGFLPAPGRIALITGRGPSMRPRIDHGDVVMVDTTVTAFDGDGVYVINVGGETQIKMLQMRGDGLYVVSANPDYPAYPVKEGDGLHIGGRVVAAMGIKEL